MRPYANKLIRVLTNDKSSTLACDDGYGCMYAAYPNPWPLPRDGEGEFKKRLRAVLSPSPPFPGERGNRTGWTQGWSGSRRQIAPRALDFQRAFSACLMLSTSMALRASLAFWAFACSSTTNSSAWRRSSIVRDEIQSLAAIVATVSTSFSGSE